VRISWAGAVFRLRDWQVERNVGKLRMSFAFLLIESAGMWSCRLTLRPGDCWCAFVQERKVEGCVEVGAL